MAVYIVHRIKLQLIYLLLDYKLPADIDDLI